MKIGAMPSLVACIVKNNTVVWSKAYGYNDYYKKINTTIDTVYPIASITKSITATAIMQLVELGLINLDDNVSKWLPFDLKNPNYPDVNITIRMLLSHQSSLGDNYFKFIFFSNVFNNYQKWLENFYNDPKSWNEYLPGKGVFYSTNGVDILQIIIKKITGKTYEDYCKEKIFVPLKMYNTSFYFSDFNKNKITCLYVRFLNRYHKMPTIQVPQMMFAAGGLKTTLSDFSHYLIMHTSGGIYDNVRILNETSIEEMHRAQYPDYYWEKIYLHGLGWYSDSNNNETFGGHGGNFPGAGAQMKMRYSDKVGIIYFWNQNSYIRKHLRLFYLGELIARAKIEKALFEKSDDFI